MPRGKKKDKKEPSNPDDLPISSLTISEAPSTSRAAPEEEEGGLGLTGVSRKQKKKKGEIPQADDESTAPVAPPTPAQPTVQPSEPSQISVPPAKQQEEEDDEGGLGLGLGGAKKKRPKKKKPSTTTEPEKPKPLISGPAAGDGPPLPTQKPQEEAAIDRPGPPPGSLVGGSGPPPSASVSWAGPPPGSDRSRDRPEARKEVEGSLRRQPERETWRSRGSDTSRSSQPPSEPRSEASSSRPKQERPQYGGGDRDRGLTKSELSRPSVSDSSRQTRHSTEVCLFKIPSKISTPSRYVLSRPVKVLTNYLRMSIQPLKIYRYDVTFKPEKPKKMIPKAYDLAKKQLFPRCTIAFDQMKNAYSLTALPKVTTTERVGVNVEVKDNNGKSVGFEVSFKATGVVDLQTILNYMKGGTSLNPPTEAIQCIDVILRQGTLESYVKAGRQFFRRPSNPISLGHGLEMWTGLFQSAIFTTQPFINIDVAHKGFPKNQSLLDALVKDFQLDLNMQVERQRNRNIEHFKNFLKGLRVVASIGGDSSAKGLKREFIVNGMVDPPSKLKFTVNEGTSKACVMTVADYFQKEKGIRLRYPDLNCLWVGPRDKNIYYPMEMLEVSYGQALNRQLNEFQLSTMVREAATKPDERRRKIKEVISNMNYSKNPYFKEFGMKIDDEFYPVQAKILQPPKLDVGGGVVEPKRGVWTSKRLLNAKSLDAWGFIGLDLDCRGSNAEHIVRLIKNVGESMGMRINFPARENLYYNVSVERLRRVFSECVDKGLKFLIIVVSGRGRDNYHMVKKFAEREVGILTQCIRENTANNRMNEQTARNILLKINSKLMGVNQALDVSSTPRCLQQCYCMVVGADVTHPSPDQSSVPSIAAVTASMDPQCFKYNIQLSVQAPKMEVIVEFEEMMLEHLRVYRQANRALPQKIFVFRDGVSEGQFAIVMNSELQAVHNAYKKLAGPDARPEVLFMLVQKRHHTRFFLGDTAFNVEPGTVVDKDIVHARELDFYLVSHHAIKGTARPTRYHAVCNDGKIPDDEVEQLTYYLCHLYSRCTRAVSYPTPTYYAHLACLRARSLTFGEKFNNFDLEKKPQRLRVMEKILETSRMFFV